MESQPPESPAPVSSPSAPSVPAAASAPSAPTRDPDLVALEGFETEFADLERELEHVERRSASSGGHAGDGAGATPA